MEETPQRLSKSQRRRQRKREAESRQSSGRDLPTLSLEYCFDADKMAFVTTTQSEVVDQLAFESKLIQMRISNQVDELITLGAHLSIVKKLRDTDRAIINAMINRYHVLGELETHIKNNMEGLKIVRAYEEYDQVPSEGEHTPENSWGNFRENPRPAEAEDFDPSIPSTSHGLPPPAS